MLAIAKKFFWTTYDHLGGLIVLNLVWSALSLPWILVGYGLVGLGANTSDWGVFVTTFLAVEIVVFAPPTMLLFAAGARWARGEDIRFETLFKEMRLFAARVQLLGLTLVFSTLLLSLNIGFYLHLRGWPGLILGSLAIGLLFAVLLMSTYLFPLLLLQNGRMWYTLRQSFLVALDNIKLSLVLLLVVLLVFVLGFFSVVGLFSGLLAAVALLLCICFGQLQSKYTGESLPEEGPRTWRELIRPWGV